jgi:hypothetical protein
VVLQRQVGETLFFCAMPFFPHYVPDEPWIALEAAQIPVAPVMQSGEKGYAKECRIYSFIPEYVHS